MTPNQNDTPGHAGDAEKPGCRETLGAGHGLATMPCCVPDLVAALLFYADGKTYETPSKGFAAQYDPEKSPIEEDKGKKARFILKKCLHEIK